MASEKQMRLGSLVGVMRYLMTKDYKRLRMKNSVLAGNFWNSNPILLKYLVNLPFIYVPRGNIIETLSNIIQPEPQQASRVFMSPLVT